MGFDGWGDAFSIYVHHTSPEIQPIGMCERLKEDLQTPYKVINPSLGSVDLEQAWALGGSTWHGYLGVIGASAVPKEVFSSLVRPELPFKVRPLQEICVRKLLSSLPKPATETLAHSEDFAKLPSSVTQLLTTARR